jgi:eukaryotic-like serine/threonine-protein kinase
MPETGTCPNCGTPLPNDALAGHCPCCLARIVFETSDAGSERTTEAEELEKESSGTSERSTEAAAKSGGGTIKVEPAGTEELKGQRIGRYKLLEKIGEGGFGLVYMAEQVEPVQRKVAFKIIKAGMDTRAVIARFEAERQALALMDHPNIAKVLDAGTTETGRPYFVMELVRGISITAYCDQKHLPTRERLHLFIEVCHAIQHAHQKGIIHRDIKPSNVLVTLHDGKPVPKVIDFGIAKALGQKLTDKTLFTGFAQLMGTPAYMSPEQAELSGLDIDTRSDIYSLGVLLYELLTGVTPFDRETFAKAALDEIRRMIRETDPPRPSTRLQILGGKATEIAKDRQTEPAALTKLVRGDLDWIVMKCLEKDRTRRYDAANTLALDVDRYLNQEPVSAAAPSAVYRTQKFVRRHKAALATATALLFLLVAGVLVSTWQAVRATRAERHALSESSKSAQVAQFLKDMLEGVGPSVALGRDTRLLREILDKTVERVAKDLKDQPEVQAGLLSTAGRVYWALDQATQAESMHRRALEIRLGLWGEQHLAVAESLDKLTEALWGQAKLVEAEEAERRALAIRTRLLPAEHPDVATSLNNLGVVLRDQKKLEQAEPLLRQALALERKVLKPEDERIGETLTALSSLLWRQGRFKEAEDMDRDALIIYRKSRGEDDPEVANVLNNLGTVLRPEGKLDEAKTVFVQALNIQRKILPADHQELLASVNNLAGLLWERGELPEAEALFREFLTLWPKSHGAQNGQIADALNNLGIVLRQEGEFDEAKARATEAVALRRKISPPEDADLGISIYGLAGVLWERGELADAKSAYQEEIAIFTKLTNRVQVARGLNNLGTVLRDEGHWAEAEQMHQRALEAQKEILGPQHVDIAGSLNNLAYAAQNQHRPTEAEPMFKKAVEMIKQLKGEETPLLILPLGNLAELLRQEGKLAEAETVATECLSVCEKLPAWDWRKFDAQSALGGILAARTNYERAEPLLLSGHEGLQERTAKIPARNQPRLKRAVERLVQLYESWGKPEKAAELQQKLARFQQPESRKQPPSAHP